jgi:ribulose 1,5-bisphosphate carboxylase large subunit-like protein
MNSKIPRDFFIRALALSGADIIYPGFSPSVAGGTRQLGVAEKAAVTFATNRYAGFVKRGWPLVTLAGGVYAGQLHCLYDLLGPEVAFFLGGAVSLHKEGPLRGADLCVRVIKKAAELHTADARDVKNLPGKLIEEVEAAYEKPPGFDPNTFSYFSAREFLAQVRMPPW